MLASGSRKSTIALGFLIGGWALFASSPRKSIGGLLPRFVLFGLVMTVLAVVTPFVMENTLVGRRFEIFAESGSGDLASAVRQQGRYAMYVEGVKMFIRHPVCGVGLNNFGAHFVTGQYSHSDYIEPLATTGVIGFVL